MRNLIYRRRHHPASRLPAKYSITMIRRRNQKDKQVKKVIQVIYSKRLVTFCQALLIVFIFPDSLKLITLEDRQKFIVHNPIARARIPATPARFMQWFSCRCMLYAKARQFWRAFAKTILKRSCDFMQHSHAKQKLLFNVRRLRCGGYFSIQRIYN